VLCRLIPRSVQIGGNISTVLIVDNDSSFRAVLRTLLEQGGGFDFCAEARSGIEAIEKSSRLLPKLVILDFSLPDMDGLQLAQELRKMMPRLPIFMLTADGDLHAEKEALSRGINAVFSKEEDLETLVANARACVESN
jgi:two-component system response regulator YesN